MKMPTTNERAYSSPRLCRAAWIRPAARRVIARLHAIRGHRSDDGRRRYRCAFQSPGARAHVYVRLQPGVAGVQSRRLHLFRPHAPGTLAALERGDSDNLVLQGFVQKYGNTVLAAPTTTGFNRIAWIMPFVIFTLGVAGVVALVRAWKSRQAPAVAHGRRDARAV